MIQSMTCFDQIGYRGRENAQGKCRAQGQGAFVIMMWPITSSHVSMSLPSGESLPVAYRACPLGGRC